MAKLINPVALLKRYGEAEFKHQISTQLIKWRGWNYNKTTYQKNSRILGL